jgi:uncharacterized membrane protein YuzA (DUF378 family)
VVGSFDCGGFGLENGDAVAHIQGMEKTIALSAIVVVIIFVAVYALSAWKSHGPRK